MSAACRHETLPNQWRVLSLKSQAVETGPLLPVYRSRVVARFDRKGKPRSRPEIALIQQFRMFLPRRIDVQFLHLPGY
jgi:hypothetical protein